MGRLCWSGGRQGGAVRVALFVGGPGAYRLCECPGVHASVCPLAKSHVSECRSRMSANASSNATSEGLFLLLFEDIDQYFSHLNVSTSNDSEFAVTAYEHSNCSFANASNGSCLGLPEVVVAKRNYWALVLVLFPIFTLFGNVLVILSVYRERTLQSATNYFIVSLALADLLVAVVVMPFAVYVLVSGYF